MALTRVTSKVIQDGTISTADLSTASKSSISGSFRGELSSSVHLRQVASTISGSLGSNASVIRSLDRTTISGSIPQALSTTSSPTFNNITATGTLTAQEIHTEFTSASILFTSGSTKFGDTSNDTHSMTGSLLVSGSITMADGDLSVTDDVVFGATATVETGLNLESGTFTIKNATGDSNGLKISQGGSDASNILNHYNGTLNLGVANSVDMTLKGGSVGIGNTDASTINSANNGGRLVVGNGSGNDGMTIYSGNGSNEYGVMYFADGTSGAATYQGWMAYYHDTNQMSLGTAGDHRVRITASGRVGIGDTSPGSPLDVKSGEAANTANFNSTNGATNITFESNGSLIGQMEFSGPGPSAIVTRTSASLALGSNNVRTLYITDDDNVGIGTASPDRAITIYRSGGIGARLDFQTNDTGTGDGNGTEIGVYQNDMNAFIWNYENSDIYFAANNTERMRISSSGFVGIQTSDTSGDLNLSNSFGAPLHILQKTASQAYGLVVQGNSNSQGGRIGIGEADSNFGTRANVIDIGFDSSTDFIFSRTGKDFIFGVNSAEKLRIKSTGQIETTYGDSSYNLVINGLASSSTKGILMAVGPSSGTVDQMLFRDGNNHNCGAITSDASANTTAFGTSSDYRLKENEVIISDGIERIKKLKPYRFNFISAPDQIQDGFFAHELAEHIPEAVTGEKDAMEDGEIKPQNVDYGKITPLLVGALKEAITKIETLETKVETLEGK